MCQKSTRAARPPPLPEPGQALISLRPLDKCSQTIIIRLTAGKEGRTSTGHALPPGETLGPVPTNLFLKGGGASKEEMLASTHHGIWITRFHYTRPVHPLKLIVTGMTRDGTFLIEKGEISYPIKNLRFTQSYLDALNNVELVGKETKLEHSSFSYTRVPALKLGKFNFTGVTEF